MTIDEALDFIDNINRTVTFSKECKEDEDFFNSVGELLEELKVLREYMKSGLVQRVRINAIDEFKEKILEELAHTTLLKDGYYLANIIKPLAEQLKENNKCN